MRKALIIGGVVVYVATTLLLWSQISAIERKYQGQSAVIYGLYDTLKSQGVLKETK